MKKLKTIACVIILLFLGTAYGYGQEKSTVLIKAHVYKSTYSINTIKPDYTTYQLESKGKGDNEEGLIVLKRELDKWILEGYVLVNSTVYSSVTAVNDIVYYLVKE